MFLSCFCWIIRLKGYVGVVEGVCKVVWLEESVLFEEVENSMLVR